MPGGHDRAVAISMRGVVTVLLPGTGSDDDYLNRALAGPLKRAGALVTSVAPDPQRVVQSYLQALDRALDQTSAQSGDSGCIAVGGVSLGAAVAARWASSHQQHTAAVLAVVTLPAALLSTEEALAVAPVALEEAAHALGASARDIFARVTLPADEAAASPAPEVAPNPPVSEATPPRAASQRAVSSAPVRDDAPAETPLPTDSADAVVERAVDDHDEEVRGCIDRGGPGARGRVSVRLVIAQGGAVRSAQPFAPTSLRAVGQCLAARMRQWSLNVPDATGDAIITWPFDIDPAADD